MDETKTELISKRCVPCMGGIPPLSESGAKELLKQIEGWELIDNSSKIRKVFDLHSFFEAIAFTNKVAGRAELESHHPDIAIHYNKVTITVYTHKINGLHENDFILAAKIDMI